MSRITGELKEKVINLLASNNRAGARDLLEREMGVKRTQAYHYIRLISAEPQYDPLALESVEGLEFTPLENVNKKITPPDENKYRYNAESKTFIFPASKKLPEVHMPKSTVKSIITAYSNFDGRPQTAKEISHNLGVVKTDVELALKMLDFTHSDLPVLKEDMESKPEDSIVENLLLNKQRSVGDKFNRAVWDELRKKANLWDLIEQGVREPFETAIANWLPPTYKASYVKRIKDTGSTSRIRNYVIGLSDLHFGSYASERYLWFQEKWDIDITKKMVNRYLIEVEADVKSKKYKIGKAYILGLGDIIHSLSGFTDKGTNVGGFPLAHEQFDAALSSLSFFIKGMMDIFGEVEVHSIEGNHDSLGDYLLFRALECYFRTDSRVSFTISNKRYGSIKIQNSLVIFEHGYSALYKARLPKAGVARESYVQTVFMQNPEWMIGINSKYFITADQHHFESKEYNDFEHIMFSSLVKGDRYSDNSAMKSRPRQNVLIFSDEGLRETGHVYFDRF